MLSEETIRTLCWSFVAFGAISGCTVYSVVKLLVLGKAALYDRRSDREPDARPISLHRG